MARPPLTPGAWLLAAATALLLGCSPKTSGGDDSAADLAPRAADLASCAPLGDTQNRLANPSFERGAGAAFNTGDPRSSIDSWDGCCNLDGQGLTSTWRVITAASPDDVRCGERALSIESAGARGDVLNQPGTLADGAGRDFTITAWARVRSAGASAQLSVDLFDTVKRSVLASAPPLTAASTTGWQLLSATGRLPEGPAPLIQVRIFSKGSISALIDDVSLSLR